MKGIPVYHDINDLHLLTGSSLRTKNPLFHCFNMKEANDLKTTHTAPHRANFYTLALNLGTEKLTYTLNENTFHEPNHFILCVAPGQVVKWKKQGDWFGYCTFFKSEWLLFKEQLNFLQQYPFFQINETNLIQTDRSSLQQFETLFELILSEQESEDTFGEEVIRSYFQAILWKVRRIYETTHSNNPSHKAASTITAQFLYLVNQLFLNKTTVEAYANLLNITPNHLSQTVKAVTGKTARQFIQDRRADEAKYLLAFTNHTVAEIAYQLSFSQPTHFSKFFKQAAHKTPKEYRTQATSY
ncbi:MAG: helix-turn-helix domain-containing protein [Bacteroidota bacterium]